MVRESTAGVHLPWHACLFSSRIPMYLKGMLTLCPGVPQRDLGIGSQRSGHWTVTAGPVVCSWWTGETTLSHRQVFRPGMPLCTSGSGNLPLETKQQSRQNQATGARPRGPSLTCQLPQHHNHPLRKGELGWEGFCGSEPYKNQKGSEFGLIRSRQDSKESGWKTELFIGP